MLPPVHGRERRLPDSPGARDGAIDVHDPIGFLFGHLRGRNTWEESESGSGFCLAEAAPSNLGLVDTLDGSLGGLWGLSGSRAQSLGPEVGMVPA